MHFRIIPVLPLIASTLLYAKELEGVRAPAATTCPSPEEAQKKMTVPAGYEVRCFAHEPMVVNPVAMTWDSRGRLWVVEGYEYPNGSEYKNNAFGMEVKDDQYHPVPEICQAKDNPLNAMRADHPKIPKDRIVILEDTHNTGVADKRTVFLEGLDMGSAILLGDGGVYVGQQPHLLHFKDTDGDDHADEWRVVLTGFGREDTHELLNSFCWGPDGWLYMTHGVFTNSRVRRPGEPKDKGFKFDAGIGRCRPISSKGIQPLPENNQAQGRNALASPWEFEVFADGTSNPWGCDYDARGNFFVSACVIDHFFHMAPGGIYVRQGGAPENPYAYELLPSIVKHKHFRAAYAGVQIYQGGVYPADTHGHAFIGNIHDNAVHEEIITPVGATFKCEPRRDFLRANDGWFRPVSTQTGPDGNLWIMDWCDKYPCYQNAKANPEGVDRERGRIWRVAYTGARTLLSAMSEASPKTADKSVRAPFPSRENNEMDLSKLPTPELVKLLGHSNNWMRRMARRQLVERKDEKAKIFMEKFVTLAGNPDDKLDALWTLHQCRMLSSALIDAAAIDKDAGVRCWAARLSGERFRTANQHLADVADDDFMHSSEKEKQAAALMWPELERVQKLEADPDMAVRFATAAAMRMASSGALTANRPLPHEGKVFRPMIRTYFQMNDLMKSCATSFDQLLQFEIWMSIERGLEEDPSEVMADGQLSLVADCQPLSHALTYKSMRRLCDTRDAKNLDLAVAFCEKIQSHDILLAHALDGLEKGQESGIIKPAKETSAIFAKLLAHPNADVRRHAQNLATLWGDPAAIHQLAEKLLDVSTPEAERIAALQMLRKVKTDDARAAHAKLLASKDKLPAGLLDEVLRAATDLGDRDTATALLKLWKTFTPAQRSAAVESLVSREAWVAALLDAIGDKRVSASDVPMTARRALAMHSNAGLKKRAEELLGQWHESSGDIKALIAAKRKACLEGEPDIAAGKMIFTATCAVCHTFHGGGQKVGPELIGSGRSNLDALLANVIDPNQIIGNGYEAIVVSTKDGRTLTGRMVEDTPSHVKLLAIGGVEQIVPRDQIANLVNTHQSLMPVGFGALPDDMFRNLIWYVLAPPEEGPLTKEKKTMLSTSMDIAAAKPKPTNNYAIDWESVSLWNPEWKVIAPEFDRTPVKLAEFHGRNNILLMHPFTKEKPSALERTLKLEAGKPHKLSMTVAAHDQGDWELRVLVNDKVIKKETISHDGERWKTVVVDLGEYADKEVKLRLEDAANDWHYEYSYWSEVKLD